MNVSCIISVIVFVFITIITMILIIYLFHKNNLLLLSFCIFTQVTYRLEFQKSWPVARLAQRLLGSVIRNDATADVIDVRLLKMDFKP